MAGSKTPIYTAFAANMAIAIVKFIAAFSTGSSAMASEGIHSLVDTSNEILLLVGLRNSRKKPDAARPFGYGKELYFWAFVVSLLFFALGGGLSIYEGYHHLQHPEAIKNPVWNYVVLGLALLFDGYSLLTAVREFNRQRGETPFWKAVRKSKDPSTFVVLFEDAADVIGILLATVGITLSLLWKNPYMDGIASIMIGLLLTAVAVFLVRESRSLLMGEALEPVELQQVVDLVMQNEGVCYVDKPLSMYQGPDEVILFIKIKFKERLESQAVVDTIQHLRRDLQDKYPQYKHIFFEPI
ncbi:cation diffusion facilitator family transporter [Olivibacter ginsenosidimutans]